MICGVHVWAYVGTHICVHVRVSGICMLYLCGVNVPA